MKQFYFHDKTLHLKVKKSPLLIQIILFGLTLVSVLMPLIGIITAISTGSGLKLMYFVGLGLFSLMGFYLLRVSLWNSFDEETIEILENKIIYEANYGWFKDGKKEMNFDELTYSIKSIGYEEENMGVLKIDSNGGKMESVVKMSKSELKELIDILNSK
jgi:hypothetical protein